MRNIAFYIVLTAAVSAGCSSEQDSQTHDSVTVASIPPDTTFKEDILLIPGRSAGNIKIDEDTEPVYKMMGKPDSGDAAMQKAVAIWYQNHDPKSYATAIYSVRDTGNHPVARIKQIRTTSPEFKTEAGIGVHSSLSEIQGTFTVKQVANIPNGSDDPQIYDSTAGIAFEINKEQQCTAVLIHPAGEALKATYLPLR